MTYDCKDHLLRLDRRLGCRERSQTRRLMKETRALPQASEPTQLRPVCGVRRCELALLSYAYRIVNLSNRRGGLARGHASPRGRGPGTAPAHRTCAGPGVQGGSGWPAP